MRQVAGWIAPILVALLSAIGLPASRGEESVAAAPVKIGLVDTITRGIPASWTQMVMRPFKALMEAQTGVSSEVVAGGDALGLGKKINDNEVQIGVFHGYEYAWAKQKYPRLQPIALCVNKIQQSKVYLVVRSSSRAASFADLKAKRISVPRMGRAPCFLYLERRCVKAGLKPEKFYSRIETPFVTEDALEDVVEGEVAAAIVDEVGLESYRKAYPSRFRRLRVLAESEPFPAGVIAYCPGNYSEEQVARFRAGLVGAKSSSRGKETLTTLRLTSFDLPPANHDDLLTAIVRAYPPPGASK